MSWLRARFHADGEDYRAITWPPPGPYWCSGYGDDYSVVIAYVKSEDQITEFWPEADNVDVEESELTFSGRFPCPKWWDEEAEEFIG